VYESEDHEDELGDDGEHSPLFFKINAIAKRVGIAGTVAAAISFIGSCIIGFAVEGNKATAIVDYLVVAITVLAVAVPEGLPLAVTLALAFSSMKMTKEQNLVKHLDACETMGCATTICTDKTGAYQNIKKCSLQCINGLVHSLIDNSNYRNPYSQQNDSPSGLFWYGELCSCRSCSRSWRLCEKSSRWPFP
jgi:magnesium-transporting ATPase (P-type)